MSGDHRRDRYAWQGPVRVLFTRPESDERVSVKAGWYAAMGLVVLVSCAATGGLLALVLNAVNAWFR